MHKSLPFNDVDPSRGQNNRLYGFNSRVNAPYVDYSFLLDVECDLPPLWPSDAFVIVAIGMEGDN